jgi:hypothetical protein
MTEFRPSIWIPTRDQVWTLGAVLGEDLVQAAVAQNSGLLEGDLIETLAKKSTRSIWTTGDRSRLFDAPFAIYEEEHGPLVQISLWEALCLTRSVPSLERCQESGSLLL